MALWLLLLLLADPVAEGMRAFQQGRIAQSLEFFDQAAHANPGLGPQLWQRGISLYYLGRYQECAAQFEEHATVNPADVENSAWWYLCAERQRRGAGRYAPVTGDRRRPMAQIDALFAGQGSVEAVLRAAPDPEAKFFAYLYIGLWHEAKGDCKAARDSIQKAARLSAYGHYMGDVARIHSESATCSR